MNYHSFLHLVMKVRDVSHFCCLLLKQWRRDDFYAVLWKYTPFQKGTKATLKMREENVDSDQGTVQKVKIAKKLNLSSLPNSYAVIMLILLCYRNYKKRRCL